MAKPVQSLSKIGLLLCLLQILSNCQQETSIPTSIPSLFVATNQGEWQRSEGKLWLNGKVFSGWQYQLWPNGDTAFVGAFNEGKAEGFHRFWHTNQQQKEIRHYQHGWQEGPQRGWFESGAPAFVYHFQNDVYEGNCQEWYANGQPAQYKHYHNGQENGSQRMWYAEGKLKANYVVRNGRTYGFTGVKNCVNVWDSITIAH